MAETILFSVPAIGSVKRSRRSAVVSLAVLTLAVSLQAQEPAPQGQQIRQPHLRNEAIAKDSVSATTATGSQRPGASHKEATGGPVLPRMATGQHAESISSNEQAISPGTATAVHPANFSTAARIQSLEPPPGWQAVEKSIREKLEACDNMLRRGAVYSARQTCWKGLEELCQILDLHAPQGKHVESLRLALVAMREEEDFYRYSEIQSSKTDIISNLCWAHETPIVRSQLTTSEAVKTLNPLIAAQHYRSYAREQLVRACDYHPWGSDLLYALGKALEKQAWDDSSRSALIHQHAEIVYQAALETNPNQYLAATQLGHVLLKLDRPQAAREILLHSVKGLPTTAGYQNLAEACRRLNDTHGLQFSLANLTAIQNNQSSSPEIPFTEIDPQQFVKISPPDVTTTAATMNTASVTTASGNSAPGAIGTRLNSQTTPSPATASNGNGGWIPSLWR